MIRIETYYKKYNQLPMYNSKTPTYSSNYNNNGYGHAKGIDFLLKDSKSIKNLQYWLSYSFTDSKKMEGNDQIALLSTDVYKHNASLVAKYWFQSIKSQIGLTQSFKSGRAYYDPNISQTLPSFTPSNYTVNAGISHLISAQQILHIEVSNILGSKPIYSYQFADQMNTAGEYAKRAILPTAKRFIFVGYFLTISKNKKDNQLNNL